ncbi:MAG: hypothetical protein JXQ75_08400 [Phycisphaerae bacterium]|nr:hypothetical protein [Phycisphaerae bacterium]
MADNDALGARPVLPARHLAVLLALVVVAAGAMLVRQADGATVLSDWIMAVLQAPALLAWCHGRCGWFGLRWNRACRAVDAWLTVIVVAGGMDFAIELGQVQVFFGATTTLITGLLLVDAVVRLYRRVDRQILEAVHLLRSLAGPWLILILTATFLLSLPLATHSAVPDYRHNFWDHVLNSAFAAVSSASLVGTTIYSLGDEYSLFGQVVLVIVTQLAGMGFAAVGLAIVQPFMSSVVRLRTVLWASLGLQFLGIVAMWSSWDASDVESTWDRLWWGVVHAGGAMWNCGLSLRNDGLAPYISKHAVFASITTLSIIGSLSLPLILDLITSPRASRKTAGTAERPTPDLPWRRLAQWEAPAVLGLLLLGAGILFFCETPWRPGIIWRLPVAWIPERPVDIGSGQISMRDDMPLPRRWALAVFVSATVRSTGVRSIPMSQGTLSWPSYGMMLIWMFVGGSAGGVAGGLRTSAILLPAICLLSRRHRWRSHPGGEAGRRMLLRAGLMFVPLWLALNVASIGLLAAVSDATAYEQILDATGACNSVGLSTGWLPHLTWQGRLVMIVIMIVGRAVPVAYWLTVSLRFTRCLRRCNEDSGFDPQKIPDQ